jgi:NIMA (never in mitosis gene a)-related kinase
MNNFRMGEKLGEGTFSVVHKVQRKSDDRFYALKRMKFSSLSSKEIGNCLNEVRILASINHPNIVSYKEAFFDEASNNLCVVTELANEGDLLSKIRTRSRKFSFFEEEEIWRVFIQALRGLDYLHSLKILHRDIKSANIFIASGVVKIGDLNVSTVLKQGMARTQTGTPFYVSP